MILLFQIMPRSKTGKHRTPLNPENVNAAVQAVLASPSKKLSFREASKTFGVKLSTIHRHVKSFKASRNEKFEYSAKNDVKKVFSNEEDQLLLNYIMISARLHYGLSKKAVRELAYKFAKVNKKKYPKEWDEREIAGENWMRGFMKKYGNKISMRKPEATSLSRCTSFNRHNVKQFFHNLADCHERFGPFHPQNIFNLDETGLTTVQSPTKIVAPKGVKQIGAVTSAERGANVTLITAVSAIGNQVPPMLVFPRVHFKDHMIIGAPPGTIGAASPSGWSNEEIFLHYLDHLISFIKPSQTDRILLIFDNHESHISIQAIDKAKENGVVLLTFPPHTSHKLQPLDRTVFGSLKARYNRGLGEWLINNPGKTFSIYNIAEVLGKIYHEAFSSHNIIKGFAVSGIYPLNADIFTDDEFLSSYVTNRPDTVHTKEAIQDTTDKIVLNTPEALPKPSTSVTVTPQELQPFPKAGARKEGSQRGKKPGKTRILTDTPEKNRISEKKKSRTKSNREN